MRSQVPQTRRRRIFLPTLREASRSRTVILQAVGNPGSYGGVSRQRLNGRSVNPEAKSRQ